MAERIAGGQDARPRIYIKPIAGGRVAWRDGWHGRDRIARDEGAAFVAVMEHVERKPAVIFWEGYADDN